MSSRQLRKLRKQQELLEAQPAAAEPGSDSDDDEPIAAKPRGNAFASFAALGDMGGDDDESEEAEQEDDEAKDEPKPTEPAPQAKAKKAKKKKKKAKGKKQDTNPGPGTVEEKEDDQDDEIDRALEELRERLATIPTQSDIQLLANVLRCEPQHLKVMNEMRNIFGREAIHAAETEESAEANQARRRGQRVMLDLEGALRGDPGKKMSDVIVRRNPFIQWRETWPVAPALGLTMKLVQELNDGLTEFTFAHEAPYVSLEMQFFEFVETYNDQGMVPFLRLHPYHVSTLLQISKLAKRDGNAMLMGDLIERALFGFGRVSLSSFRKKLEEGKAALDFRRPENRQFFLAGFNYIKCLVPKGTFRTALEWSKVLLSLNIGDQLGVINFAHVLAIRSHEAQWFLDLCNSPFFNPAASTADTNRSYIKQTIIPAKLQLGDEAGARAALEEGIRTLPWLYVALFSALNLDTPKSIWGIQPRDSNDEVYTKLYIHTAKDIWNTPQLISLLTSVATSLPKPDINALPTAKTPSMALARFIYLNDTTSLFSLIPTHVLSAQPNYDFDPLPPPKLDNIFSNDVQQLPWQQREARIRPGVGGVPVRAGLEGLIGMAIPAELREQFEEIEAAVAREQEGGGDPGDGGTGTRGVLGQIMEFMFGRLGYVGTGGPEEVDGENTDTEDDEMPELPPMDEDERERGNVPGGWETESGDSDDEMPALVPLARRDEGGDSDDEMPELFPAPGR